jgi:hypothetical protein
LLFSFVSAIWDCRWIEVMKFAVPITTRDGWRNGIDSRNARLDVCVDRVVSCTKSEKLHRPKKTNVAFIPHTFIFCSEELA